MPTQSQAMWLPTDMLEERLPFPEELKGVLSPKDWDLLIRGNDIRFGQGRRTRVTSAGILWGSFSVYAGDACLCFNNYRVAELHKNCWKLHRNKLFACLQMIKRHPDVLWERRGEGYVFVWL